MSQDPAKPVPSLDPELWVDQHGDFLFRFALARVGNRDAAEDLVQETFLAALRAGQRFAGKSTERTWFVGILKNKIVDYLRRQAREGASPPKADSGESSEGSEQYADCGSWKAKPADWGPHPAAAMERHEFWVVFRDCLSRLPERLGRAFALRELDQLSGPEVCELLSVTAGNLGVLLFRARMQLRRCLEVRWFQSPTSGAQS